MDNAADVIDNALDSLVANNAAPSQAARLRPYFEKIETALSIGIRREQIFATLNDNGIAMNLAAFDKAMYRLRKRASLAPALSPAQPLQSASSTAPRHAASAPSSSAATTNAVTPHTNAPTQVQRSPASFVPIPPEKVHPSLPNDWRTGHLLPAQAKLLTPAQKIERDRARDAKYFPNRYRDPDETST
ncbi:hypothetical protein [Cupriavidus sp. D39]|uniref:hypothetical protein n=1 Tax=Cupriavidus sp. D39 TaxID=2997877 RepID=UPI00227047B6|nr:hypothetical protein [Cupriavidus sp. D39]MCY0858723.1 hypothetical protein [Cupriavidus sp. D39]